MARPSAFLVRNGLPCINVDTPPDRSATVEFAVEELQTHLARIAGRRDVRLRDNGETTVRLRVADDGSLEREAFSLDVAPGAVTLTGGSDRAVLYGVYEMLDRLGCRWLAPDADRIPRLDDAALAVGEETAGPAFEYRDILCSDINNPLWLARNRLNGHFSVIPEYMGGHDAFGMHVHTFYALVPPGKYFDEHPEYFSMVNGERTGFGAQLCLTNPDLPDIVADELIRRMKANPRCAIWSVSQNDWQNPCACPECAKVVKEEGAESGPLLRFVNAVAERTATVFPDTLISTIAYQYTVDPPRVTKRIHPNVRVRLCPICCCQAHPFGECDHPRSSEFHEAFSGWAEITDQMYIWHYSTNFRNMPFPMPDFDELQGNIEYYRRAGVHGIFFQGSGGGDASVESGELRSWLCSRLLWNPDRDIRTHADEWLAAVYGKGAADVRRYYDMFHERPRRDPSIHPSCYDDADHPLFGGGVLKRAEAALDTAKKKAPAGFGREQARRLLNGVRYAAWRRKETTGHEIKGKRFRSTVDPERLRAFDRIITEWRRLGVRGINEGGDLETSVRRLRATQTSHDLVRLDGGAGKVFVAPSLGGRVISWTIGETELLVPPHPDFPHTAYPYNGGYSEMVVFGPHGWRGADLDFVVETEDADAVVCTASVGSGVHVRRRVSATDDGFRVESRLDAPNGGPSFFWNAGLLLSLPGWRRLTAETKDGATAVERDAVPDFRDGAERIPLADAKEGTWRVEGGDTAVACAFSLDEPETLLVGRDAKDAAFCAVDARTRKVFPTAGETLEMTHAFSVVR